MSERPLTTRMLALLRMFNRFGGMTSDSFHFAKAHCCLPHEMPTVQTLYILHKRRLLRTESFYDIRRNRHTDVYVMTPAGFHVAKDLGI